ncbi:MAG: TrkA family potassium uptake protein [Actinomycetota bacterium]|nr:TrkA family potassium uptake protein [Actinomycetota bacterium]
MIEIQIVISGGGKVGSFLARDLSEKGHTVIIIEKNSEICERLATKTKAMIIEGDACDYRYQEEARVDRADVFAAVTGDDDDNLVACELAKTSFNVPRVVARVNNPKNERIFNLLGIDAISSTTVITHLIEEETTVGDIITLHILKKGRLAIVEVDIPEEGCTACSKRIEELALPVGSVLVSVFRGDELIIPQGKDVLKPGDSVIAVTKLENEEKLRKILIS